jgi:hypothetical protein
MNQAPAIGIGIAAIVAVLCFAALASDSARIEKSAAVDAEHYADFIENEVFDIQDLAEGAEIQRRRFNRMTPPGFSWVQPMFPSVVPFDAENFDEKFLDELLGEDKNSVAFYPLSLTLDPKTRETLVFNADGNLIAAIPPDRISRSWPEDADPARVTLQLDLLPSEDVEPYLYTESLIAEYEEAQTAKTKKSGGMALRSLGATEFGIAGVQRLTNGNTRITVTNGTDAAEVFAYTVWHTSSVSVVVWTNEFDEVLTNSHTAWHPVSPSFDGIESAWEYGATNLTLSGSVGIWEDANVSSNARVRFYAAARRIDSDADGLSDGAEVLIHRTDPALADTDEDGHSDGREVALGTDPLDGTDYFGIVINAALPIPPPPGSEVGREWVELFNAGLGTKSLAGFRLQTALPSGWSNVFTFPAGVALDSGDFMVIGNGTNGDFQANLYLPNSSFTPPGVFGIRLAKPDPVFHVADALFYGFTNEFGFSLDGFGEALPIVRPRTNWVVRRTWVGFDTDHPGNWKNVPASLWPPHRQGEHLDLDGDGLSNAEELAGGLFPIEGGTRIDEADSDFDGISDADELALGTDPNNVDTDGDAFPWSESSPPSGSDADELSNGTDPLNPDSDGDGIPDGWELAGGLDPLSPDSDGNGMPDGDEDSDGDGVPNAVEVANLTNPFDPQDVDPRPYIWLKNGQIVEGSIDEGDIGHLTTLVYHIKAQSNCPPIMVRVAEGGYVVESFFATCSAPMIHLNPGEYPATNRVFCIIPGGRTNFTFRVIDGGTVWENENPAEYGADIVLTHAPAILDLDAGVPEASEETVGFLLASKNAHDGAQRRALSIQGPENTWGYASNIVLTYDTARLRIYDEEDNVLASGTQFYEEDYIPALEVEGLAHSGAMRDAWINVAATGVPVSDRVNATVLKADIGTVGPLADRTLHPGAARQPLTLKQTLPSDWNGLMELAWSGAVAYWTPTGGTPIVSGSVFSNALLPQIIYLEGDGCGTNEAVFSVVGLDDCKTNLALGIFGMNATLAGVAETDELAPGGFIADRSVHTNAPRTMLTLEACGPVAATGNVVLTWNSSVVQIYTVAAGGSPLAQFSSPYNGFTTTNLYVEGVTPGSNTLAWTYSAQTNCADKILVTVFKIDLVTPSGDPVASPVDSGDGQNEFTYDNANPGVLNVHLKASVLPSGVASQIASRCSYAVSDIATSTKSWAPGSPNGTPSSSNDFLVAQAIFTGLPVNNSAFGSKMAIVTFDSIEMKRGPYEVFFPKWGYNHGGGNTNEPNWFIYWKDGAVAGIPNNAIYDASADYGYVMPGVDSILRLGPLAADANSGPEVFNSQNTTYGSLIVTGQGEGTLCVAETVEHELYHLTIYQDVQSKTDTDYDGVADSSEPNLTGVSSDPNNGDTYRMRDVYGSVYLSYGDNEIRCRKKELDHTVQVFPAQDWANPGGQNMNVYGPTP